MCSDKNKKKHERAKETYPLSTSTPLTVFLIAEKLLSLCVWNFHAFFAFIKVL